MKNEFCEEQKKLHAKMAENRQKWNWFVSLLDDEKKKLKTGFSKKFNKKKKKKKNYLDFLINLKITHDRFEWMYNR